MDLERFYDSRLADNTLIDVAQIRADLRSRRPAVFLRAR